ncbi:hypothetical protein M407DRAFT_31473 [Tulasnella calospora MUT 4182]|uniref:Uncharacterized protein n=1 Tax=Tulasnella calospora MUT 4182 TaxID=1051891 RepID=A0A0C3Q6E6_9AGAM|nr:hypothetical protein M407DRAFT_31473 [Tulasnella calospora MUT 4182]
MGAAATAGDPKRPWPLDPRFHPGSWKISRARVKGVNPLPRLRYKSGREVCQGTVCRLLPGLVTPNEAPIRLKAVILQTSRISTFDTLRRPLLKRKSKTLFLRLTAEPKPHKGDSDRHKRRESAKALVDMIENQPDGEDIVARRFIKSAERQRTGLQAFYGLVTAVNINSSKDFPDNVILRDAFLFATPITVDVATRHLLRSA